MPNNQPECYDDKCTEIYLSLINMRDVCVSKESKDSKDSKDEKYKKIENNPSRNYCKKLLTEFKLCEDIWSKCKKTRYIISF